MRLGKILETLLGEERTGPRREGTYSRVELARITLRPGRAGRLVQVAAHPGRQAVRDGDVARKLTATSSSPDLLVIHRVRGQCTHRQADKGGPSIFLDGPRRGWGPRAHAVLAMKIMYYRPLLGTALDAGAVDAALDEIVVLNGYPGGPFT
jgi:hypothetical protein